MNQGTFFENFGLLVDASNGIKKLRGLILTLAVQGKLVPQNPNDEPASVFLEKIEERSPESIRILLTGEPTTANIDIQISKKILHCQHFIPKPWSDEELIQLIKNCLKEQALLN